MDKNKGFTLIEMIVMLGIITVVSGFTISKYNVYSKQLDLKNSAKKITDVFELAKKMAFSGNLFNTDCINPNISNGYKITVTSNSYSLLFGCRWSNPPNGLVYENIQSYNLPNNITVTSGTGDYFFPPLMINPKFDFNSITLYSSIMTQSINITISPVGIVELGNILTTPIPTSTPGSSTPTPTPGSSTPTPTPGSSTPTPTPGSSTPTPTPTPNCLTSCQSQSFSSGSCKFFIPGCSGGEIENSYNSCIILFKCCCV